MATEGGQILKPNGKLTNPLERHGPGVTDTYLISKNQWGQQINGVRV